MLHDVLGHDRPVALDRIEKALAAQEDRSAEEDAALTALIWRRNTNGRTGILGAFLHPDCARKIDVLAAHLDAVGASDAAAAVRDLRAEIPLEDNQIENGVVEWIDTLPDVIRKARELDQDLDDVGPVVWSFLQDCMDDLPNLPLVPERKGLFRRFRWN